MKDDHSSKRKGSKGASDGKYKAYTVGGEGAYDRWVDLMFVYNRRFSRLSHSYYSYSDKAFYSFHSYFPPITHYTSHSIPYTLHLTPYTLHLTPYTLHLTYVSPGIRQGRVYGWVRHNQRDGRVDGEFARAVRASVNRRYEDTYLHAHTIGNRRLPGCSKLITYLYVRLKLALKIIILTVSLYDSMICASAATLVAV